MRIISAVCAFIALAVCAAAESHKSPRSEVVIASVLVAEREEESSGAGSYEIKAGPGGRGIVVVLEKGQLQLTLVPARFPLTAVIDRGPAESPKTMILLYDPGDGVGDARLIDSLIVRPSGALQFTSDEEHAAFLRQQHETEEAVHGAFREAFRALYHEGEAGANKAVDPTPVSAP